MILGDGGIQEKGDWQDLKAKSTSILKFAPRSNDGNDGVLVAGFDRLSAQMRARDEAEVDLSRQTGDFTLYGMLSIAILGSKTDSNIGYYFRFAGLINILLLFGSTATYSFFITIPQYWLQLWTQSSSNRALFWILGFLFLSIMSWSSTSLGNMLYVIYEHLPGYRKIC